MRTRARCPFCLETQKVLSSHFCLLPFASPCCLSSLMEVLVFAPARGPPPDPGGLVCHQLASRCLPRIFLPCSVFGAGSLCPHAHPCSALPVLAACETLSLSVPCVWWHVALGGGSLGSEVSRFKKRSLGASVMLTHSFC